MTSQQDRTATVVARPTPWSRDMTELLSSFWGDLDWPRRVLGTSDEMIRIEEAVEDDTLIVRAEIPGVDPDQDAEICVDDGVLTISAKRAHGSDGDDSLPRQRIDLGSRSAIRHVPDSQAVLDIASPPPSGQPPR